MSFFVPTRLGLHAFIVACCMCGSAFAQDQSALDVLKRMQEASQRLNYHGTLIFLQDGQVQSMSVVHKSSAKGGEFERLINLNGAAREVVRKDDVVICYMPDIKEVMVSRQKYKGNVLSQLAANNFSELQKNYQFTLEDVERVAGRQAQRVLIKPKDTLRYGYRVWVDSNNAILLKSDLLDEKGESLEQAMFADIAIVDQIPEKLLQPTSTGDGYTWYEKEQTKDSPQVESSAWAIDPLPSGFAVSARFRHQMPGSTEPTEHWIITDGLANISVYFEKMAKDQEAFKGASPMGAVNAFGTTARGHQITVIGEVPVGTVKTLAQSVTFAAGADE